jgi:hypothetical protein
MPIKPPTPLESEVLTACLQFLELKGIECWRQNQGAIPLPDGGFRKFNGRKGICDISGILDDGRRLEVEVKREGEDGREEQWEFIDMINSKGGVACLVHSVEELEQDMKTVGVIS